MAAAAHNGVLAAMEGRTFNIRKFILVSILLHMLLFLAMLLTVGGIFGGPGPGGGDSVTFELSAGVANDRFAAPPEPVAEPEIPQPEPVIVPPKKPEAPPRRSEETPPPEEEAEEIKEVVDAAKRVTGVDFTVEVAPRRAGDPPQLYADPRKIQGELGWKARHTDLQNIVATAWRWFKDHPDGYGS